MMKTLLLIGLLFVGVTWCPDAGTVRAATSQPGRGVEQAIVARDFERVIFSALIRQYGRPHHRVGIRILYPKKPLIVPAGRLHLEIEKISGGARTGRRSFRVGLFVNDQFIKTVSVVGEVKAKATVATPVRWIKPKEIVRAEDVRAMTVLVPSLTHDFVLDLNDVIGKEVLRPLPPRQPIRKALLDDPPIIRKGDRVMLEVRQGGLLVQAVGLAKATGKFGDIIPVKNQHSGRELVGRIMGAGFVEVGF